MPLHDTSRRRFIRNGALLALSAPLWNRALAARAPGGGAAADATPTVRLNWLERQPPASFGGVTWGVSWPQGQVPADSGFVLHEDGQTDRVLQSWPLAYWPDGSLKWSAHALGGGHAPGHGLSLRPAPPVTATDAALVTETAQDWVVDTGRLRCQVPKNGERLIGELWQDGRLALGNGRLVLQIQSGEGTDGPLTVETFQGHAARVTLEQNGPQRAVIALRGVHRHAAQDGVTRLPFVVRLYFYAGSASLRLLHTIIYDGDEQQTFIKGLGVAFDAPQQGELHDRHVRFTSAQGGLFREAVRGLTGLRRDPGEAVIAAQLAGKATPPVAQFPPAVGKRLDYIPAFGSYRLTQHHPDGYQIHKRTAAGQGWLLSATGQRASGSGYLGSPVGGVAFGIRHFWQSYPACLEIQRAHTDLATITLWLWSPYAEPMDLRFYHDGMGQASFEQQREALEITYEDYEPGFATPEGVARTSELFLDVLPATPDSDTLLALARRHQQPPLLVADGADLQRAGAFGPVWSPAAPGHQPPPALDAQLAWYFDFYQQEVEQRKWYGFWDFGDVMHTYDSDRHVWRYDVGGYAWDNSELSTDLWLWYYFLRSGRADVFRMAEAMTRHTGEVDVHHAGRFQPLGSRHNVRHWGDSAKQLRISTVANRRFLYYLTADERIGELMDEQVEALRTLQRVMPGRKIGQPPPADERLVSLYFGTDWGAVAAAWLTAWERRHDAAIRDRLLNSMRSIAAQPHGFFTGLAEMDPDTGVFRPAAADQRFISHLSAVFGLAEVCAELLQVLPDPAFERAWLDYCRLYNDPAALSKFVGQLVKKRNLVQGHARLSAFAGWRQHDKALIRRAWREFLDGEGGIVRPNRRVRLITPPAVLYPVKEAEIDSSIDQRSGSAADTNLSTNAVAQWGLTAIAMLALAGDAPPR
ncbi:Tat pathway signal sequence domain protein [Dickeya fangzhongdai]|uniref:exo-rhamnogalacturonan lyase family protein n=1 Tax=Dickeya fangzhongdai TaxID=1778540 RepID=UPI001EFBE4EB|nr:Tat pathway signal sequence domain protein [Dickeya fangzhongdai]ULR32715.1 Tat pathway signal sequence domain protein [Dickeya fangzhongdai]